MAALPRSKGGVASHKPGHCRPRRPRPEYGFSVPARRIKSASVYTVGPICYALGIDLNAYFGISPPAPESVSELLRLENKSLRIQREHLQKSLRMHRLVTLILLSIVALCAFALVVDILSPTLGWFRA